MSKPEEEAVKIIHQEAENVARILCGIDSQCNAGWMIYLNPVHASKRLRSLSKRVTLNENDRLHDIGPGAGHWMFWARFVHGCKVSGNDWDTTHNKLFAISRLSLNVFNDIEEVPVLPSQPLKLQEHNGPFDVMTCFSNSFAANWGAQEHNFMLNDFARFLVPGGRFYMTIDPKNYNKQIVQMYHGVLESGMAFIAMTRERMMEGLHAD